MDTFERSGRPAPIPTAAAPAARVSPQYPSSARRLAEAKSEIDDEVGGMTVLTGRALEIVQAHQRARATRWQGEVGEAHSDYLSALVRGRESALATHRSRADDLDRARNRTEAARRRRAEAVDELGPGGGPGRLRNPEPHPGRELGSPRSELLAWIFVPLAVGADIAAFYTVLALLFKTAPLLVVVGTVGFAAGAVGLAHTVGIGIKRRKLRLRQTSSGLFWSILTAWAGLGVIAFLARLNVEPVRSGQEMRPLVLAATFAILYVVSGVLAMGAAFAAFDPAAWAARKATRLLRDAEAAEVATRDAHESAVAEREAWEHDLNEEATRKQEALAVVDADDAVARQYAELAVLRRLDELEGS